MTEQGNSTPVNSIFQALASMLEGSGLDLSSYRESFVMRRIAARMQMKNLKTLEEYLNLIGTDASELATLVQIFSVNVTEFFRDREFYHTLRSKVIPELQNKLERTGELSIWCAGCASGEEPYSVAILLADALGDHKKIKIMATDRSATAIQIARTGEYGIQSIRKVPVDLLSKCFINLRPRTFRLRKEIMNLVEFFVGDITKESPCGPFDSIFCRNVLIYLSKDAHRNLFDRFGTLLCDGGYLMLGQSELVMNEACKIFEPMYPRERIYRRVSITSRQAASS